MQEKLIAIRGVAQRKKAASIRAITSIYRLGGARWTNVNRPSDGLGLSRLQTQPGSRACEHRARHDHADSARSCSRRESETISRFQIGMSNWTSSDNDAYLSEHGSTTTKSANYRLCEDCARTACGQRQAPGSWAARHSRQNGRAGSDRNDLARLLAITDGEPGGI